MRRDGVQHWRAGSHFFGAGIGWAEALYEQWLEDPEAVPEDWRRCFAELPQVNGPGPEVSHSRLRREFMRLTAARCPDSLRQPSDPGALSFYASRQAQLVRLVDAYRQWGHRQVLLDPLGQHLPTLLPVLEPEHYGLGEEDMNSAFDASMLFSPKGRASLREILTFLQDTYCRSIGVEFMHISDAGERQWLMRYLEQARGVPPCTRAEQVHLLERIIAAEGLEKYLGSRYPGTKRFGLEGAECLIPMLDEIIQRAGAKGVVEAVLGMAHRGRLNVLVNILGKSPVELFDEFEGVATYDAHSGDVKYHQGFSSNVMTASGELHLALAFNPSHLEIVVPVVEGSVRARQDRRRDIDRTRVVPIVLHGDAAITGQGVVMETLQMSRTRAYHTGGTLHIVLNNQIGFTTARADDMRSADYCTDIAKMIQAPVFHVNGDDPEAVLFASRIALDYRQHFHKDVMLELVCYRRRGHNEADEPAMTQPEMYRRIRHQPTLCTLYARKLITAGILSEQDSAAMKREYREDLEEGRHVVKSLVREPDTSLFVDWEPHLNRDWDEPCNTGLPPEKVHRLAKKLHAVPDDFQLHRQVAKVLEERFQMGCGKLPINWGCAEIMAYASLLEAGHSVRLVGQDVERGTFAHRHAVLHDQEDGREHIPLADVCAEGAQFYLYNSLLSEMASVGFEYGYAATAPNVLVVWEAQFGDFVNNAQVVIDQFLSSGEDKWRRLCGLTLLLPHGYEGQGPEHSSARLERFLQLCGGQNMQVCMPTTPAQIFHLLRRQVLRPLRKPLVVMTPKSLLRHREAVSTMEDLSDSAFRPVQGEMDSQDAAAVRRLLLCSGKVYYDLRQARLRADRGDIAIVRLEQLYPFPAVELAEAIAPFANIEEVIWCQEEPRNQGAWYTTRHRIRRVLDIFNLQINLGYAGRAAAAAPAVGYADLHQQQQQELVEQAIQGQVEK